MPNRASLTSNGYAKKLDSLLSLSLKPPRIKINIEPEVAPVAMLVLTDRPFSY